jgi:BASS family bile acid:Na+ symporter
MRNRRLKYLSQACLYAGFLVPLLVSRGTGMPWSRHPLAGGFNVGLWAAGLLCGYGAYSRSNQQRLSGLGQWNRACTYLTSIPATFVTLAIGFGYLYYPSVETNVVARVPNYLLMAALFAMGAHISTADWKGIWRQPRVVAVAVIIRWITMPAIAYMLATHVLLRFLNRPTATALAIGLMVLGTTPTGAASNTLTLISRGDLALSVSVTTMNTILAPFLQPFLIYWFIGSTTHVNTFAIFMDLVRTVLIPVLCGSLVGAYWTSLVNRLKPTLAALAVLCLALIILGNMAKGTAALLKQLWILPLTTAVLLIYGMCGLSLGYFLPKLFGFTHRQRVAACFEVGVENAALTQVLIFNHFAPFAAMPAILYGKLQHILAVTVFVAKFQKIADKGERIKIAAAERAEAKGATSGSAP